MKEIWDQVLKIIPSEALPALVLIAAVFFGVYYAKGLRNYTDAVNDRWFLTATVLIVALFAVLWIQKAKEPEVEKGSSVVLLVPRFEADEGRNVERLFAQEVQTAVHAIQPQAAVVQFDGYVRDRTTAALTAKDHKATAVIFQPQVIRLTDKILICFSVFTAKPETTKPYNPTSAQIDKAILDDIASTVLSAYAPVSAQVPETLIVRIDSLERRVAELAASVVATNASIRPPLEHPAYPHKHAIVVGVDGDQQGRMPKLQYAASDANSVAQLLKDYGFDTVVLLNASATKATITQAVDKAVGEAVQGDLILVYYGGSSFRSTDVTGQAQPGVLVLPGFDIDLEHPLSSSITLSALVQQLNLATSVNKLIILDGCHGTFGLSPLGSGAAGASQPYSFQIVAGSQDDGFGLELPDQNGGAFTQALLRLMTQVDRIRGLSTNDLLSGVSAELDRLTSGRQRAKLVTLSGSQDIILSAAQTARPPR